MTRNLFRAATCFALATALLPIHRSAPAQETGETTPQSGSPAATNELQAAPPADVNDAPGLPPPATKGKDANGPILNRADRSLLVNQQEAAPEQKPAPQATITSKQNPLPLPAPANRSPNAAPQTRDGQAAAFRGGILFGRMTEQGLPIDDIAQDSIFYRNGLRAGDVVISLGGRPIRSDADFARAAVLTPGQRMPIVVLRNGEQGTLQVNFAPQNTATGRADDPRNLPPSVYLGVVFDPEARDLAVVRQVNPGSPAERAGLQVNDIILGLNGEEVRSAVDAVEMIRVMQPGDPLAIVIERSRSQRQLTATLDAATRRHTVSRPMTMEPQAAANNGRGANQPEFNRANESGRRFNRERENGGGADNRNRNNNEGRGLRLFRFRD